MRHIAFCFLVGIYSIASAADGARLRLDEFSKSLNSLSANFEQTVREANSHQGKTSSGTLALKAPRQFRWDVAKPYQQQIVADGEKVWIYDPDLEQVTVRNQGTEEAHSPLTVLTDLSQLDRDFTTSEQGEHDGFVWLRLKSKDRDPQFEYADLGFDAAGLQRMKFEDALGNETEIRFSNWQRNPKFSDEEFKFVPPKGADVVGDPTPAAVAHPIKD